MECSEANARTKNSALTENGILQAKQLGERMKDLSIHAIYSSPE